MHNDGGSTMVMSRPSRRPTGFLAIQSGLQQGRQIPLPKPGRQLLIGRSPECDVIFDQDRERMVSRTHARVEVRSSGIFLTDLDSVNKTFLGSQVIQGTVQLRDSDAFQLGTNGPVVAVRILPMATAATDATLPGATQPPAHGASGQDAATNIIRNQRISTTSSPPPVPQQSSPSPLFAGARAAPSRQKYEQTMVSRAPKHMPAPSGSQQFNAASQDAAPYLPEDIADSSFLAPPPKRAGLSAPPARATQHEEPRNINLANEFHTGPSFDKREHDSRDMGIDYTQDREKGAPSPREHQLFHSGNAEGAKGGHPSHSRTVEGTGAELPLHSYHAEGQGAGHPARGARAISGRQHGGPQGYPTPGEIYDRDEQTDPELNALVDRVYEPDEWTDPSLASQPVGRVRKESPAIAIETEYSPSPIPIARGDRVESSQSIRPPRAAPNVREPASPSSEALHWPGQPSAQPEFSGEPAYPGSTMGEHAVIPPYQRSNGGTAPPSGAPIQMPLTPPARPAPLASADSSRQAPETRSRLIVASQKILSRFLKQPAWLIQIIAMILLIFGASWLGIRVGEGDESQNGAETSQSHTQP